VGAIISTFAYTGCFSYLVLEKPLQAVQALSKSITDSQIQDVIQIAKASDVPCTGMKPL
jgi:hypothetical protein